MESQADAASHRLTAVMREGERVTPLELFFDLVFVLALTQCTALMVGNLSWEGVAQAMVVLALLWWTWTGYAWLTSVVDPEEGAVRLSLLVAMAALLIAALTVPSAFTDYALEFALAYAVVRAGHIALFLLASRDDPLLRHSGRQPRGEHRGRRRLAHWGSAARRHRAGRALGAGPRA